MPDGTIKVLVEGTKRAIVEKFSSGEDFYLSEITFLENDNFSERENQSLSRTLMNQFDRYVKLNKKVPPEIIASLAGIDDVSRLIDTIAAHISIKLDQKQKILETVNARERLQLLITLKDRMVTGHDAIGIVNGYLEYLPEKYHHYQFQRVGRPVL